jgi:hypothetical protein
LQIDYPAFGGSVKSGPTRPDGFSNRDPIELEPATPSGSSAGIRQLRRCMSACGSSQGYLYGYDVNGMIILFSLVTP